MYAGLGLGALDASRDVAVAVTCCYSRRWAPSVGAAIEEEQKLKKKVLKGNWGIAKDKASCLPPRQPRSSPAPLH